MSFPVIQPHLDSGILCQLDKISLNPASKRIVQSLSDFQTGIGTTAHAALETEQLTSPPRTALVDTFASLLGSDCAVIAGLQVHELLTKINDILTQCPSLMGW